MLGEDRSNSNDKEIFVQLAGLAFKKGQFRSVREAARAFRVTNGTLQWCPKGTPAKRDISLSTLQMINSENSVLVKHI
jgi:hypothetical protein